jgi:hypothetical protein
MQFPLLDPLAALPELVPLALPLAALPLSALPLLALPLPPLPLPPLPLPPLPLPPLPLPPLELPLLAPALPWEPLPKPALAPLPVLVSEAEPLVPLPVGALLSIALVLASPTPQRPPLPVPQAMPLPPVALPPPELSPLPRAPLVLLAPALLPALATLFSPPSFASFTVEPDTSWNALPPHCGASTKNASSAISRPVMRRMASTSKWEVWQVGRTLSTPMRCTEEDVVRSCSRDPCCSRFASYGRRARIGVYTAFRGQLPLGRRPQ